MYSKVTSDMFLRLVAWGKKITQTFGYKNIVKKSMNVKNCFEGISPQQFFAPLFLWRTDCFTWQVKQEVYLVQAQAEDGEGAWESLAQHSRVCVEVRDIKKALAIIITHVFTGLLCFHVSWTRPAFSPRMQWALTNEPSPDRNERQKIGGSNSACANHVCQPWPFINLLTARSLGYQESFGAKTRLYQTLQYHVDGVVFGLMEGEK